MKRADHIAGFTETIWDWYTVHKRKLSWRDLKIADDTERAYRILVSEIMLQQTQVSRVQILFKRFIEQFPALSDLARASNKEVIVAWRGLGYNNRALRLRNAAHQIIKQYNGKFPTDMEPLLALSGVGHYTAAAIRNFAFNLPTPCLDTNIRRILHRAFIGAEHPDGTWKRDDKYLLKLADEVLEIALNQPQVEQSPKAGFAGLEAHLIGKGEPVRGKPLGVPLTKDWHAALMDFGSIICTKRNPKWDLCPLTRRGLMKAAYKVKVGPSVQSKKTEPGRLVGSTFIPNRIFRGKIIEYLRDDVAGRTLNQIGREIAIDWDPKEHRVWIKGLIDALTRDALVKEKKGKWMLAE